MPQIQRQQVKLSDIAEVQLGMAFKTAITDLGQAGDLYLIQSGDINQEVIIRFDTLAQIGEGEASQRFWLSPGDVMLRLRGPHFHAGTFYQTPDKPVITTNQVAIIRANLEKLDPLYLTWYLNSPECRRYFESCNEGSNIAKLNRKLVSDIPFLLPSMKEQQEIARIQHNWQQQKSLQQQLLRLNEQYFDKICTHIQQGTNGTKA